MSTRLDRLVLLLDTGSTQTVRHTAAKQLGEIQKQHPNDLYHLLSRILVHLRSKTWETRVACGVAIESICENVAQWDPPPSNETYKEDEDGLRFSSFNITQVVDRGEPLVASQGKEFDVDLSDMDPKERLALQKKRLRERLGLGTQFMDVDFFDEQDVKMEVQPQQKSNKISLQQASQVKKEPTSEPDPFAGLSARERAQMKRKARMQGKKGSQPAPDITSSSAMKKRKLDESVVVQHKDVTELGVYSSGDEWPFEGICEQLCLDLFSPQWEIRHGAAIGLRDIIKVHGNGVGKLVGLSKKDNERRHELWLEDVAIRLLCVLALDKFADFVGDQAIVPVRETCAQTLAVVMQYSSPKLALQVMEQGILKLLSHASLSLQDSKTGYWEVRHAALIGLKYWMAVRTDLLDQVLVGKDPKTDAPAFTAIVDGLKDKNDDVRAVASSSLIPVSEKLVQLLAPQKVFHSIVVCLWASLQELDDLTAATSFVMDLLADLVKQPTIAHIMRQEATNFFQKLVPQLFPFFRHAIHTVRMAVLRTLITLSDLTKENNGSTNWVTIDLMRLVFQNFIVEERREIVKTSKDLWTKLVGLIESNTVRDPTSLGVFFDKTLVLLFALIMSPPGTPIDTRLFVQFASSQKHGTKRTTETGLNISPHDKAMVSQDLTIVDMDDILHGRLAGVDSLGQMMSVIIQKGADERLQVGETLNAYLMSAHAGHRVFCSLMLQACAKDWTARYTSNPMDNPLLRRLWDQTMQALQDAMNATLLYQELVPPLQLVRSECIFMRKRLGELGVTVHVIPPMPNEQPEPYNPLGSNFSIQVAETVLQLATVDDELVLNSMSRLSQHIETFKQLEIKHNRQVKASFASFIVSLNQLPPKLNPIIRPLMDAINNEENAELQERSAQGLAQLIRLNILNQKKNVNEHMVKNICVALCEDPDAVGKLGNETKGILTLDKMKQVQEKKDKKKKKSQMDDLDAATTSAAEQAAKATADDAQKREYMIKHRGAEQTLARFCVDFGPELFEIVTNLWSILEPIVHAGTELQNKKQDFEVKQELADSLHILATLMPHVHHDLFPKMETLVKPCIYLLSCPLVLIRHLASKALASMGQHMQVRAMRHMIDLVIPLAGDSLNDHNRQGAVEVIFYIVEQMQEQVLPYLVFLIVPLLGRMSDSNEDVRFLSTNVFAQLVKLSPLEAGVPNPADFTPQMIEKKNLERKFVGQLIGSEKVSEFSLPISIKADLRPYQKEGVSWLAFLNRYGLHGILCDDMGLGKTLQSICMMASDHFYRQQEYEKTKKPDKAHCPSLVVCPSTLTGHWFFEIKKYCDFMKPIIYAGDREERASIRRVMMKHDIIIISYEVLRNDLEELLKYHFNYITLDEGHVIKNPQTKLTKAVKSIKGFHRLILSGTPVQNNVLELWSLFDFLMPGFLGTEQQFNERFGKPILQSRDAKASSREQERGALALEALHKQVLPFLMRRMKEDVLDDLPPKIIQDYYCELSEVQKMLYENFSSSKAKEGISSEVDQKKGQTHIFQALQYLRKLCNHPSFVLNESHPQYEKAMKAIKQQGRKLPDVENSPKLMALQQLLLDCGIGSSEATSQHRVLIFAQMKQMLDLIETQLFKRLMPTVTYMRLDGQLDGVKRHELVQNFNSDPSIDCLLLTTHVGGLGLNLTGADTVIFVEHDWNPMKDLQAMDRAHRIGQKKVVNVYRLITKGTLEEKIMGYPR
ncbi:SNF2 family N-terminal domain-containing protein [Gorgonomyces haynaldii]|nr:SNF2 family N-terminal domain-containing protein [Gorgonomyces haynaldii]